MTYAINLYFNKEAETYITSIWRSLESLEKGKCLTCANGRPHITLAIYDNLDLEVAKKRLETLSSNVYSFDLKLLQIGIFPHNKGAIFLTPNLTDRLFQIHRHFHQLFKEFEEQGWDYYKPQSWYPHCTLSLETPTEHIPSVLEQILKVFRPIDVSIRSIGIVSLDPINYLFQIDLREK